MGFIRNELVTFMDELVELASEENKARGVVSWRYVLCAGGNVVGVVYHR